MVTIVSHFIKKTNKTTGYAGYGGICLAWSLIYYPLLRGRLQVRTPPGTPYFSKRSWWIIYRARTLGYQIACLVSFRLKFAQRGMLDLQNTWGLR